MKKRYVALLALVFLTGLGIFLYPIISNYYNDNFQTRAIDEYQKEVESRTDEELEQRRREMEDFNKALANGLIEIEDPLAQPNEGQKFAGEDVLIDSMDGQFGGAIAVLTVPAIKLTTPVFDDVTDMQLQRGVGVLPGTSLPIGGEGSHSVITGHRGLPTAKLFSDLPSVEIGDVFFVEILGETLAYEVRTIKTIDPIEIGELRIMPGEDVITLLTCTPYMINTHRLIVSGYRIPYTEEVEKVFVEAVTKPQISCSCIMLIAFIIFAILHLIMMVIICKRLKKMLHNQNKQMEIPKQEDKAEIKDQKPEP